MDAEPIKMELDRVAGPSAAELSDGEILEEETSTNGNRVKQELGPDVDVAKPQEEEEDTEAGEGATEPVAKKRRLEADVSPTSEGNRPWQGQAPSRKQLKKIMKRKKKEKLAHQELENKYATIVPFTSSDTHLKARQADVIKHLVSIAQGIQAKRALVQKLKTIHFQSVVSHLVTGCPPLGERLVGLEVMRKEHRVVVVWLSMISADFIRTYPEHFPKLKKLTPCVMFDIEHPGSTRFVKLGLESFMMLQNEDGLSQSTPESSHDSDVKPPTRCAYLFSLNELSDNDFPTPTQGSVDQLGRDVGSYVSVVEWPSCEISDTSQVVMTREGKDGMPMFAIDCEMVETGNGSELGRISIINEKFECVYDTCVKPDSPVVDYRTKFSGLSESILADVTTTLKDVHEAVTSLLPPNSILLGHSLENDFHAMKFRHPFVIDTSCIFTPLATPTAKPGLRKLCKELLEMDIQTSEGGHDPVEDATACMKLVQLKLRKGAGCKIAFNELNPSIFTEYRTKGCITGIVDKHSVIRLYGKGSNFSPDVATDEEAVTKSIEIIPKSKFTFVQLHSMEYLLKSENGANSNTIQETADAMDCHVMELVEKCPEKTIVFVVCGSSDIKKVRSIQQQECPDFQHLRRQVMVARTGCVIGVIVN